MSQSWTIRVPEKSLVKSTKTILEQAGVFDKSQKIVNLDGVFFLPVSTGFDPQDLPSISNYELVKTSNKLDPSPSLDVRNGSSNAGSNSKTEQSLKNMLPTLLKNIDLPDSVTLQQLMEECPTRYQLYEPLILFTAGSFTGSKSWSIFLNAAEPSSRNTFFSNLTLCFSKSKSNTKNHPTAHYTHVAENAPIIDESDILRLPSKLMPLYPTNSLAANSCPFDNLWVQTTQNGIKQTWAPAHTMFSRGNIKEKARILNIATKTVAEYSLAGSRENPNLFFRHWPRPVAVDMYAGIGYFTFSYLKAGFGAVLCWELNPWSIQGLIKGAKLNKWNPRQFVFQSETESLENKQVPIPQNNDSELQKMANFLYSTNDAAKNTSPKNTKTTQASKVLVFQEDNIKSIQRLIDSLALVQSQKPHTPDFYDYPPPIMHINMGLLPSTNLAWPTVSQIARFSSSQNVTLHVHANLSPKEMDPWCQSTCIEFQSHMDSFTKETGNSSVDGYVMYKDCETAHDGNGHLDVSYKVKFIHLEKIKTYAPGVWHVCGDFVIEKELQE